MNTHRWHCIRWPWQCWSSIVHPSESEWCRWSHWITVITVALPHQSSYLFKCSCTLNLRYSRFFLFLWQRKTIALAAVDAAATFVALISAYLRASEIKQIHSWLLKVIERKRCSGCGASMMRVDLQKYELMQSHVQSFDNKLDRLHKVTWRRRGPHIRQGKYWLSLLGQSSRVRWNYFAITSVTRLARDTRCHWDHQATPINWLTFHKPFSKEQLIGIMLRTLIRSRGDDWSNLQKSSPEQTLAQREE